MPGVWISRLELRTLINWDHYLMNFPTTVTGCTRRIDGEHQYKWAERLGMQECKLCGAKNWVGLDDPRLK